MPRNPPPSPRQPPPPPPPSSCCWWWCRGLLAFFLKFLNFLQAFIGVSIIIYSVWMLGHWNRHRPLPAPPSAPSPDAALALPLNPALFSSGAADVVLPARALSRKLGAEIVPGLGSEIRLDLNNFPAPWFIFSSMGIGIVLCSITFVGYVAAETNIGCCLCFFTLLTSVLIIFEAALVGFIMFNKQWDEVLPYDPTGELDSLRSFIKENFYVCKWVGLFVLIVQALSLLLSMILRAMASSSVENYDSHDDYTVSGGGCQPHVNSRGGQTSGSTSMDGKGTQNSTWNSRLKDKYGLNMSAFTYNY